MKVNQRGDSTNSLVQLFDRTSPTAALNNEEMSITPNSCRANNAPHYKSNTNSIDRNSHFKYVNSNGDNLSITGNFLQQQQQQHMSTAQQSPYDIKEFEKKLINLPTFTISDENALQALLPNAISNSSMLFNVGNGSRTASRTSLFQPDTVSNILQNNIQSSDNNNINNNNNNNNSNEAFKSANPLGLKTSSSTNLKNSFHSLKASVSTEIIRMSKNQNNEINAEHSDIEKNRTNNQSIYILLIKLNA